LPPLDIARRRSREALRATDTELVAGAEYELASGAAAGAGAAVCVGAVRGPVLRTWAAGCEPPVLGNPALPLSDNALRRARTSSRVLLYAIINPIASWLFQSLVSAPVVAADHCFQPVFPPAKGGRSADLSPSESRYSTTFEYDETGTL
jgi:hypothetical protein